MVVKNFIQKINDKEIDAYVHNRFIRFSVGEYPREKVLIKRAKESVQVQTGADFANDLFFLSADILAGKDVTLSGEGTIVSSNKSLNAEIESVGFVIKAQRGKKYTIGFDFTPEQLKTAIESMKNHLFLMKFKIDGFDLKMKLGLPKPGSIKEKFATLKVNNEYGNAILDNFLFDVDNRDFKSAEINHTFFIDGAQIPDEYKDDFKLARLHAKKVGKIHRVVSVDGEVVKEYDLELVA
jgi:hypothetical protein